MQIFDSNFKIITKSKTAQNEKCHTDVDIEQFENVLHVLEKKNIRRGLRCFYCPVEAHVNQKWKHMKMKNGIKCHLIWPNIREKSPHRNWHLVVENFFLYNFGWNWKCFTSWFPFELDSNVSWFSFSNSGTNIGIYENFNGISMRVNRLSFLSNGILFPLSFFHAPATIKLRAYSKWWRLGTRKWTKKTLAQHS